MQSAQNSGLHLFLLVKIKEHMPSLLWFAMTENTEACLIDFLKGFLNPHENSLSQIANVNFVMLYWFYLFVNTVTFKSYCLKSRHTKRDF